MSSVVVMTGGGIKGATAAAREAADHKLILLHVNIGQPSASAELGAVRALAASFPSARLVGVDMPHVLQLKGSPVGDGVLQSAALPRTSSPWPPRGGMGGLMPVLLSAGVQCALENKANRVVTGLSRLVDNDRLGLSAEDHRPDCCREFLHAFELMIETVLPRGLSVRIEAPLIDIAAGDIIKLACHLQVPLEHTRTCERKSAQPCRQCVSCSTRAQAFLQARKIDPLQASSQAPPGVAAASQIGARASDRPAHQSERDTVPTGT